LAKKKKNITSGNKTISSQKNKKSNWRDKWKKNKTSYLFIGSILIFGIFSFWVTSRPFFETISQPILNTYAEISNGILKLLGQGTKSNAENIYSSDFSIQIKKGCDAIAPMILYTLSILFFPVAFKHKPKGILVGLVLLFVLNIIRIVSLYLTGKYIHVLFDIMHTDIWQIIFIVFTLYLWLMWLRKVTQKPSDNVEG
jgi:exosortase/archaeosortase family protein